MLGLQVEGRGVREAEWGEAYEGKRAPCRLWRWLIWGPARVVTREEGVLVGGAEWGGLVAHHLRFAAQGSWAYAPVEEE
jgi:hypothetical protein